MPFKSDAQRRWMYATHPAMAKRWQKETPKGDLPEKVSSYDDTMFSEDPTKMMPRLRQIHKFSDFPTGSGPEDWDAMKESPGKVKSAAGLMGGGMAGPVGAAPSMSEQYFMGGMGVTGSEESMPIELLSMAGPKVARGAEMSLLARRLANRPSQRMAQRQAMREADNSQKMQALSRELELLKMKDNPTLLAKIMEKKSSAHQAHIEKLAAPRHIKILRKLMGAGKVREAEDMVRKLQKAKALKISGPGTNIKRLGTGAEAVADVTVGSKVAPGKLTARKAYDPKGALYSKQGLGEKNQAYRQARAMGLEGQFAMPYGSKIGRGAKGGRYMHTELLPQSSQATGMADMSQDLFRDTRNAGAASQRSGRKITTRDMYKARDKKREAIEDHLTRRGVPAREARAQALKARPEHGGTLLGDLHEENVRRLPSGQDKIVDFTPTPSHRMSGLAAAQDAYEAAPLTDPLLKQKQMVAKSWEARTGVNPGASNIGHYYDEWFGANMPAGIHGGPRSGKESVERSLKGLGHGSRQAPKARGAKGAPAERVRALRPEPAAPAPTRASPGRAVSQAAPARPAVSAAPEFDVGSTRASRPGRISEVGYAQTMPQPLPYAATTPMPPGRVTPQVPALAGATQAGSYTAATRPYPVSEAVTKPASYTSATRLAPAQSPAAMTQPASYTNVTRLAPSPAAATKVQPKVTIPKPTTPKMTPNLPVAATTAKSPLMKAGHVPHAGGLEKRAYEVVKDYHDPKSGKIYSGYYGNRPEAGLTSLDKLGYRLQGETEVQGIPVAIENRKGSVRTGIDSDGHEWRTKMKNPYGYIKGTKGVDGEPVDAYVGPDKEAPSAFVVHQRKDDGKGYDEDKVMLGFPNKLEAKKAYLAHYDDPKFLGPISTVSTERLKELVAGKKQLVKISQVSYAAMLDEIMTKKAYALTPYEKAQITRTNTNRYGLLGLVGGSGLGSGAGAALGMTRLGKHIPLEMAVSGGGALGAAVGAALGGKYGKEKGKKRWKALMEMEGENLLKNGKLNTLVKTAGTLTDAQEARKRRKERIRFIRKAGPAIGGALGAGVGTLVGIKNKDPVKSGLAGLGLGATLGWTPDMLFSANEALNRYKRSV